MKIKNLIFLLFLSLTLSEKIKFSKLIKKNDSLERQPNNLRKDNIILNDVNIKRKLTEGGTPEGGKQDDTQENSI